jgi:branched-chain amino acid transport system permease protein
MSYFLNLAIFCCIFAILSASLNLAMGLTGLLNLGHIAFFAVGAYTSALLVMAGVPFLFALIAAAILAGLSSFLVSIPTLRLKGHYFAIAAFGIGELFEAVAKNWFSLTKGPMGLAGIPKPQILGFGFNNPDSTFVLYLIITVICILIIYRLANSPFGRVLRAIREDEIAAKALGKETTKFKIKAVLIGALFAGIAGSMYAHYIMFIDPNLFNLPKLIMVLSMVVVGGLGSVGGSVLGAVVIFLIPEPLRFLQLSSTVVAALRQLIYSLVIILVIMFKPHGLIKEKPLKVK